MDEPTTGAVDVLCREVITAVASLPARRPATYSCLALFKRIAGSWDSLCALVATARDQDHMDARANDCAAILRCMYEAYLQAAYITVDPKQADDRGRLYLEYEHVERFSTYEVVGQDNKMAQVLAQSPLRPQGEQRMKTEFNRVKSQYASKKKPNKPRDHWYPGTLRGLASKIGREDEYVWFVKRFHSSIHSGPFALLHGYSESRANIIEQIGLLIVGRSAKILVDIDSVSISSESAAIIESASKDILNLE